MILLIIDLVFLDKVSSKTT